MITALYQDEAGFVVSAELVLVATIGVLALLVGLTEVSYGVNQELEDVGAAVGSANQSYYYFGVEGVKGKAAGSRFHDEYDECDSEHNITCEQSYPRSESY